MLFRVSYKKWRNSVIQKANNVCEECGSTDILHAHHKNITLYQICKIHDFDINKILLSKEFNDTNNGQSLCLKCHISKHPYDKRLRNKQGQFCRLEDNATEISR